MVASRLSLDTIQIASPCSVSWEQMAGTERVRFCSECSLQVYNLSDMTPEEAEQFLLEAQGNERTCIRFFRRADGTILTQDCLGGLRRLGKRLTARVMLKLAAVVGITCGGFALLFGQKFGGAPRKVALPPAPAQNAAPPVAAEPNERKEDWCMGKKMDQPVEVQER